MDLLHNLIMGFQVASTWENLFFCFVGTLIGTLIGALPGIGPSTGVAILIPITFGMNATTAIITMAGVYYGAMYGGSTTSILLNIPGESCSVVTTLDGYQLAKNGRPGPALGMAALSSFIAGSFAILMLTFIAPTLASYALSFGPPEYFALTFLGLTMVTSLGGDSMLKGVISAVIGLLVSCVGIDTISGLTRFTFNSNVSPRGGWFHWHGSWALCHSGGCNKRRGADATDLYQGEAQLFEHVPKPTRLEGFLWSALEGVHYRVLHRRASWCGCNDRFVHGLCSGKESQ